MPRLNPLTKCGFWLIIVTFVFIGVTWFVGENEISSMLMRPIVFFCALYFTIWIIFQYQTGEVSLIGQSGMKYTYKRKKNPILFYLIIGIGFLMGVFLTIAIGSDLFLGCEGSLINNCASI